MRKLATASLSFAAAILISRYFLPYDWLPLVSIIATFFSLAGFFLKDTGRLRLFIVCLSMSFGLFWAWAYTEIIVAPSAELAGKSEMVTAVVLDYPSDTLRGFRVDARIRHNSNPAIGARLYFSGGDALSPGDIVEFTARFVRTDGLDESERIDALSSRGAFLAAYVSGEIRVIGTANALLYFPQRLARLVAEKIDSIFTGDVSAFMQALLTGKRAELDKDTALRAVLSASGISHVVAVSGMHVAFLMGFLGVFIRNKRLFSVISIPILLVFMAMTGFSASVVRAGMMQMLVICAPIFRRESDTLTSLSAALLVLLAVNPFSIVSAGLQLSFAATFGIVMFTYRLDSAITRKLRLTWFYKFKPLKAVSRFVSASFATTIGAMVFTIPLTAYHFGHVSLVAPLTNMLTLWVVALVFPLGIIACILGFIFMPLASLIAVPITVGVRYIIGTARLFASLPYSSIYTSNSPILFWLIYIYIMYTLLPILRARARQYLYASCFAVTLLCAVIFINPLFTPGLNKPSVNVLDVGQGQAAAILTDGHTVVVDCGGGRGYNAGEVVHDFLASRGRTSIDLLIITHYHADHMDGVEYLISRSDVAALAVPPTEGSVSAENMIEYARNRGVDVVFITEAHRVSLGGKTLMLYPPLGNGNENERGISVLSYSEKDGLMSLITGDMNAATERALLRYADFPIVDLLLVGHHGSKFSTSDELLSAVRPTLGAISVGQNSYGHPAPDTLARLEEHYVTVFRTDLMGNLIIMRE